MTSNDMAKIMILLIASIAIFFMVVAIYYFVLGGVYSAANVTITMS